MRFKPRFLRYMPRQRLRRIPTGPDCFAVRFVVAAESVASHRAESCGSSCDGRWPAAGLQLIDRLLESGQLQEYHLAHSARGELLRRNRQFEPAVLAFERALTLARQEPEKRFLSERIVQVRLECGQS